MNAQSFVIPRRKQIRLLTIALAWFLNLNWFACAQFNLFVSGHTNNGTIAYGVAASSNYVYLVGDSGLDI